MLGRHVTEYSVGLVLLMDTFKNVLNIQNVPSRKI